MDQQRHGRQRTGQHASYPTTTRQPDYPRLPMLDSPANKFPFPPPTPFPGMPTRPLNIPRLRHSPSLPLTASPSPSPAPEFKIDGRHISYPVRTSSSRVLRRTQTTGGSGRSAVHRRESAALAFKEPVVEHKTPRMSWLQTSISKRESMERGVTAVAAERKEKKGARLRSATEPTRLLGLHDNQASSKRAISASGMGMQVKNRMGAFALGSSEKIEEDEHEQSLRAKAKGWRQRMFSREKKNVHEKQPSQKQMSFEEPRVSFEEPRNRTSSAGSVASSTRSDKTVLNDKAITGTAKENICQLDIPSKLTVATAGNQDIQVRTSLTAVEQWQIGGGGGSQASHESRYDLLEKSMNEGVIGLFEGKMAGLLNPKPERYAQHWNPPVLSLDLKGIADVVQVPVAVEGTHDIWVALTLKGTVVGDADIAAANTGRLGLDVGVLMDTSSYTSPTAFEDMRRQARQIVEGMDTSHDRIAVMTFSCPSPEKRRPSARARTNLKILNSSGSVAKKQLIGDIAALEPGIQSDPTARDVQAAVMDAIKTLHAMPLDTSKYGSRRSGHLFLITGKMDAGELEGDFGDVKVHILGVGSLFRPNSEMGVNGFCTSVVAPMEIGSGTRKIIADELDIEIKKPVNLDHGAEIKAMLNLLRTGMDIGKVTSGSVFLTPGEGCRISSIIGPLTFDKLLPGDQRTVMVKIEVGDLENWPPEPVTHIDYDDGRRSASHRFDFDELERHLEATLGELKTCILTAEVVYQHSLLPAATPRMSVDVQINRYVRDNVWGSSRSRATTVDRSAPINGDEDHAQRVAVHELLMQTYASETQTPTRGLRQIAHTLDVSPDVVRELHYREWLTERYCLEPAGQDMYAAPMVREFETSWSPPPALSTLAKSTPAQQPPASPPRLDYAIDAATIRNRSPDEARKLWMKLGGFEDEDELAYHERPSGGAARRSFEESEYRRASTGQDTIITMRNVKETDFSPWVV